MGNIKKNATQGKAAEEFFERASIYRGKDFKRKTVGEDSITKDRALTCSTSGLFKPENFNNPEKHVEVKSSENAPLRPLQKEKQKKLGGSYIVHRQRSKFDEILKR